MTKNALLFAAVMAAIGAACAQMPSGSGTGYGESAGKSDMEVSARRCMANPLRAPYYGR